MIRNEFYNRIRELFKYHDDGTMTWEVPTSRRITYGARAGSHNIVNGLRYISFDHKQYLEHRIIWIWHNGDFKNQSDRIIHIDFGHLNNRIQNLKCVSYADNALRNRRINKELRPKGVSLHSNNQAWSVQIRLAKKDIYLGLYYDLQTAAAARHYAETILAKHNHFFYSEAQAYLFNHLLGDKRQSLIFNKILDFVIKEKLDVADSLWQGGPA